MGLLGVSEGGIQSAADVVDRGSFSVRRCDGSELQC